MARLEPRPTQPRGRQGEPPGEPSQPHAFIPAKSVEQPEKGCRTNGLDGSAEEWERRVVLGFSQKIPMKAGCKPALQLYCPAPTGKVLRAKGLTLGAGGSTVFGQSRQRPFRFLFARQVKQLFSSQDSATIGLLRSRLEAAGIDCEIRNEFVSLGMPGSPFDPELWVLRDEDFAEASELLAAWRQPTPPSKRRCP